MSDDSRRLERVIDLLPHAITVVDASGTVVISNRAAAGLAGVIRRAGGEPYEARETPLERSLRGEIVSDEPMLLERGGRRIAVLASSAPLMDAGGTIDGAVAVYRDVTAQVRREGRRTELIATLTHDLGNPIFAVTVAIQLALRRLPADLTQVREALQRAEGQMAKMAHLVRELSEVGRRVEGTFPGGSGQLDGDESKG